MAQHVGQSTIIFFLAFFSWLDRQHVVIKKHPYSGMDYCKDPDLILPIGAQWGAMGKSFDQSVF